MIIRVGTRVIDDILLQKSNRYNNMSEAQNSEAALINKKF